MIACIVSRLVKLVSVNRQFLKKAEDTPSGCPIAMSPSMIAIYIIPTSVASRMPALASPYGCYESKVDYYKGDESIGMDWPGIPEPLVSDEYPCSEHRGGE